jgi:protein-arginine kinase activator protein McsA
MNQTNNKCSVCGRTDMTLTTFLSATTMKQEQLCSICQAERSEKKRDVATYDKELAELAELAQRFESLIMSMPKESKEMEGMGNLFFTPMAAFRDVKMMISHLEIKRMEAMVAEGSEAYLKAELEKALAAENFEKAATLRKELDEL